MIKNKNIKNIGIIFAVFFLILSYISFLQVNIIGFFISLIIACGIGIIFSDDINKKPPNKIE